MMITIKQRISFAGSWEKGPVVAAPSTGGADATGIWEEDLVAAAPSAACEVAVGVSADGVGTAGGTA